MSKVAREIIHEAELQAAIERGLYQAFAVAKAAYGPGAGNAFLELPYGDPLLSRDGVTNVEKVYLSDPIENMAARTVVQASRKNNRKVGDGTTAVVILAYHLYKAARARIGAGANRMQVSRELQQTATEVIAKIDKLKKPVDEELLKHVAVVSAGDEAIGAMIADVINDVGVDGGVTVEDFPGVGIYNELVDGFYFRKGFTNVNLINDPSNLESRHENVDILITDKSLRTAVDVAPILEKIIGQAGKGAELVIIGDVQEEALTTLLLNRLNGNINTVVVDAPVYGPMRTLFLEDIAVITGGKVLSSGANANSFEVSMLGSAKRLIVNEFATTIIGAQGAEEDVAKRIEQLREQLDEAESQIAVEALRDRLAKLTGKIAIIRVGGATEIEQSEVKLRVEDAICAVQAAIKDGIVPGGGICLLRTAPQTFTQAFQAPFMQLVENVGLNPSEALWRALETSKWHGYDLRNIDRLGTPTDLLKAGVVDPASVIKEVVRNATSVVAQLITASVGVTFADREQKHD